jgi:RNA polymerase sigma-70 factor (ECF subfamily)
VKAKPLVLDAPLAAAAEAVPAMDETTFRLFYDRTARPVWAYLAKVTGDPRAADDLLQEAFYRFYRSGSALGSDDHRKNYLYRIATNLARDRARRRGGAVLVELLEDAGLPADAGPAERIESSTDLDRAMAQLKPAQREMLWLAYAEGASHEEIAEVLGVRAANVRSLLSRARKKLAGLLGVDRG